MFKNKTYNKKKLLFMNSVFFMLILALLVRLTYIMIFESSFLQDKANALHARERDIKARRGHIFDRNGIPLAVNKPVNTISVIHNQIKDPEGVATILAEKLGLDYAYVKKKVDKKVALERIKTNVSRELADEIRAYQLAGVMIDEDYKRWYPYENLASHVIGFTGGDNQGIIGLEVQYEEYLKGIPGQILTITDARGIELNNTAESRVEPVDGNHLITSLDLNIQQYAEQALESVLIAKGAKRASFIMMDVNTGEIYAMATKPDFDLNEPFNLDDVDMNLDSKQKQDILNLIWRNYNINDTYEPGSTFKVVTAAAGLEEGVVSRDDSFYCPGYKIVEDRRIRCHKDGGHGSQTFFEGVINSCNPVFMEIGERLGVERFYNYFKKFGFYEKTGVDLPGEAIAIVHKKENVGPVELATMSFGQSFNITPLQLIRAGAAVVNGGNLVTPHFGVKVVDSTGDTLETFAYNNNKQAISTATSLEITQMLEAVVEEGTGRKSYLPGYQIGGKTATSEKLPRSENKYISSFLGFAPADNPQVIALLLVDEPTGIYYGGTVAAPVVQDIYKNVLPYIGITPNFSEDDLKNYNVGEVAVPNLVGLELDEAKKSLREYKFEIEVLGEGTTIKEQFPMAGELVNKESKLILYAE